MNEDTRPSRLEHIPLSISRWEGDPLFQRRSVATDPDMSFASTTGPHERDAGAILGA